MVAPGLIGGPLNVGLITFGLNILCRSWFLVSCLAFAPDLCA